MKTTWGGPLSPYHYRTFSLTFIVLITLRAAFAPSPVRDVCWPPAALAPGPAPRTAAARSTWPVARVRRSWKLRGTARLFSCCLCLKVGFFFSLSCWGGLWDVRGGGHWYWSDLYSASLYHPTSIFSQGYREGYISPSECAPRFMVQKLSKSISRCITLLINTIEIWTTATWNRCTEATKRLKIWPSIWNDLYERFFFFFTEIIWDSTSNFVHSFLISEGMFYLQYFLGYGKAVWALSICVNLFSFFLFL